MKPRITVITLCVDDLKRAVHFYRDGLGLPLFSALQKPIDFKLISSTAFGAGAIANVYRPA